MLSSVSMAASCPELAAFWAHVQAFTQLVTGHGGHELKKWMNVAGTSRSSAPSSPACAATRTPYIRPHPARDSGVVEDQINRIMLKR